MPDKKVQHGSTRDPISLQSPALDAVDAHVGSSWVTDTPEAKERALRHSAELQSSPVLWYMATDIFLQGKPTAPRNISAIRVDIWGQMKPQQLAPHAAMMVVEAKVMPKLFAAASKYHPTATIQQANDAPVVRCWKQVTDTSRHTHTESLWGPWRDGCMGLR